MKPTPTTPPELPPLLAIGAHPDDIEFACGGIIAKETRAGRSVHFIVCSRGESATHGTPEQRTIESAKSAAILGASLEFVILDGDAHLEHRAAHAMKLARAVCAHRPGIVLAPAPTENQHPDHARLGAIVRDAARLARYGGIQELSDLPPHAIQHLLFYAVTVESEPHDRLPILIDVSAPQFMAAWTESMLAHASQQATRNYIDLQLARARANGLRAGVENAIALFPSDPIVFDSLAQLDRAARHF